MIEISVKDTGTGIKIEDQDKLFKLFGFLDNTKEINTKGVGLGLHISQKITQEFGGKIVLES
jgi:signal transduction histidine kinase